MRIEDLAPKAAAALDFATEGLFFIALGELLDADLDPHIVLVRRPPDYAVIVLGLAAGTDALLKTVELPIAWKRIDERVRFGVLELWCSTILESTGRERNRLNVRLAALGLPLIKAPGWTS